MDIYHHSKWRNFMIERKFLNYDEALNMLGGNKYLLDELVEFHGLRLFVKLHNEFASQVDDDSFIDDTLKSDGFHELAHWAYFKSKDDQSEECWTGKKCYRLSGWFKLTYRSTEELLDSGSTNELSTESYKNNAKHGEFINFNCSATLMEARFSFKDIVALTTGQESNAPQNSITSKSLREDREESLLKVIAALWAFTNLPDAHNTAAEKISALLNSWDIEKPSQKTIADTILSKSKRYKKKEQQS